MISLVTVAVSVLVLSPLIMWWWYQWKNRRILAVARTLPSVFPTVPFLGHAYKLSLYGEASASFFLRFFELPRQRPSCFWIGPVPYFVLHRFEDIQEFFKHTQINGKPPQYSLFNFAFGIGLVTAPHDVWKKTRRHLSPVFHPRNLHHLMGVFNSSGRSFLSDLARHIGHGPFDVNEPLILLTASNVLKTRLVSFLIAILDTAFGPEFQMNVNQKSCFHKVTDEMGIAIVKRILQPWLWLDFIFNILYASINKKLEDMYCILSKPTVVKMLEECEMTKGTDNDYFNEESKDRPLRLDDTRPVTVPEAFYKLHELDPMFAEHSYMKGELNTILSAGSHTTAATLGSCLVSIGQLPYVQERLLKEVLQVIGKESDSISMDDISKMTYMDQVIKESMRRFSIIPFVARTSDKDIAINDLIIPAGGTLLLSLSSLHMDPTIYANPAHFDPEHFNPDSMASREKYTFLPFFGGVRDCFGKHYAMIQMKIILSHIIRRYRIHSSVDINKMRCKFTLLKTSIDGYLISIENRDDTDGT